MSIWHKPNRSWTLELIPGSKSTPDGVSFNDPLTRGGRIYWHLWGWQNPSKDIVSDRFVGPIEFSKPVLSYDKLL